MRVRLFGVGILKRVRLFGSYYVVFYVNVSLCRLIEPRSEKTGLRGFRPGPTQTGLRDH